MDTKQAVNRVTMSVYCLAKDIPAVKEEFEEMFYGSDAPLWRGAVSVVVDDGVLEELAQARLHLLAEVSL